MAYTRFGGGCIASEESISCREPVETDLGLPINLDNLQDMLMGRPFIPGGSTVTLADSAAMRLDNSSGSLRLLPRRQHPMADYGYVLDLPSNTHTHVNCKSR